MIDLLKLLIIFVFIIYALRLRWNLGLVMLVASALLGVTFFMSPREIIQSAYRGLIEPITFELIVALTAIMVLENILRKTETLKRMMDSLNGIIKDSRVIMASVPALIGLLPSVGGAVFSAPMVDEAGRHLSISNERKAFINYWFRHPWEYIFPLYPGIVLASAIEGVHVGRLVLTQLPLGLAFIIGGIVWGLRGIKSEKRSTTDKKDYRTLMLSLFPIIAVILLVLAINLQLSVALIIVIGSLFLLHRYSISHAWEAIRKGVSINIIWLVTGVMVFKEMLKVSGAAVSIPIYLSEQGIPVVALLFLMPFLTGLLTGLTVGFVGITFPMLVNLLGNPLELKLMAFAFGCGYLGVLLSPVHLCFILTREYFKADIGRIYRIMIMPSVLILIVAVLMLI